MTNDKMHPSTRGYLEVRVQQWSDSGANTANLDVRGELWPEATECRLPKQPIGLLCFMHARLQIQYYFYSFKIRAISNLKDRQLSTT